MSGHAMVRKGGTNADHTYPYQSKGFHSRPSSPLIEEIVGISKPRSKLMDFKQVVVAQPAQVNYKDRAKKNRSMLTPSMSFEGLVPTSRLMKPNNYMLMSTNTLPSTTVLTESAVDDYSANERAKRTGDTDTAKPVTNIMSEFIRPPLHSSRYNSSRHSAEPKHYTNNNSYVQQQQQQSAPLSPQSDYVVPGRGFFNDDDDDDDVVPGRRDHGAEGGSLPPPHDGGQGQGQSDDVSLDWILELGMQQFKSDHALERNAVKEASKTAASKADFSYAAPLDSHPENFLLERFDKDFAARKAASAADNNNNNSSSNVPILGINDNPILKKLNKRDRSLFKRNMEIKVLSRASVLAIVDNRSSSGSRPSTRSGRSIDGSGFDFYAAAASAAASVGLGEIASILSTDDNNFDVLSKFQPLPIDLDLPSTSSAPSPHHHHHDAFNGSFDIDDRAVSPDRMSHTIQRPVHHPFSGTMMSSSSSSSPPHKLNSDSGPRSTHSNDRSSRDSHLSSSSRPKSTSALIDLDYSYSDPLVVPSSAASHSKRKADNQAVDNNNSSNNTTTTTDNNNNSSSSSIIGVRTKLKFEGPYVNSPYVWHMTKEVDKLVVNPPPPGIPMSTTTIKKKKPKTKSAKDSSTSIHSRDSSDPKQQQQHMQEFKQSASIDLEPTSSAASVAASVVTTTMHVSKSLPSGILAAPSVIRPVTSSLDLELPSRRQSKLLPEVKAIRSASSSRRFSQDVRQITSSVYSILVPPSGHQTTDLYRPSLAVHRKQSELISENQSSRVLSPGLLDVQPSLMRTNTKLHAISSSSSLHVVPSKKPLSIDFLVSSVQGSTSAALKDVPASRDVLRMEHDSMSLDSSSVNGTRGGSLATNLEKAGVLINDLVGDPLYRILQEEIESLYHDSTNSTQAKVTVNPAQQRNDMLILNTTSTTSGPSSSSSSSAAKMMINNSSDQPNNFVSSGDVAGGKVKKGNSKTGLSNYRTRSLHSTINTSELKILSTFRSLPSGVWFTCRVVYFLVMAYYEYVIRRGKGVDSSSSSNNNESSSSPCSNLSALWAVLEKQQVEEQVTIDSIENNYSWPLLQLIIEKFPLQFTKLLHIIEFGSSHASSSSSSSSSPPKGGKQQHQQPPPRMTTATTTTTTATATTGKEHDISPAAAATVFFNSFPLSNLILLRNIVKQGMWIFQSHALMHTVTVSAQLCDWCKRVMAGIYTSCLVRLRALQSVGNNAGVSALRSTAYYTSATRGDAITSSSSSGAFQQQQQPSKSKVMDVFKLQVAHNGAEHSRASMPPYFTFVLAVDDAFNAQTFFNYKKSSQNSRMQQQLLLRGGGSSSSDQYPSTMVKSNIPPSEMLSRALSLVKPSDRLDLLLIPPHYRDMDNPLGVASFTANYDDESFIVAAVTQLYIIWESISHAYTEHLQHFSSSPMHRVCIVPVEMPSESAKGNQNQQSQHMLSVIRSINSIISSKLAYASSSPQDHGIHHHHPVIEHCMQYDQFTEYSPQIQPTLSPSNNNNSNTHSAGDDRLQADILITRLKNGRVPKLLSSNDNTHK